VIVPLDVPLGAVNQMLPELLVILAEPQYWPGQEFVVPSSPCTKDPDAEVEINNMAIFLQIMSPAITPANNAAAATTAIIILIRFVMLFSSVLFVVFLLLFPWPAANRKTTGAHAVTRA